MHLVCSLPSLFFHSSSCSHRFIPTAGLPGRAYRCVCTSFAADAGASVPLLCERAGAGRAESRCVALARLAATEAPAATAAALARVLADTSSAAPRTAYGALRLVLALADTDAFWHTPEVPALVRAIAPLAEADAALPAPRRLAATACDTLCAIARACASSAALALRTVVACETRWFGDRPLLVRALAALAALADGDAALAAAAAPLLHLVQAPRAHAGSRGLEAALTWAAAAPMRPRTLVLLALVLGRRADASGFDAAVATSSVVPLLFEHAHVLLTGCGDPRLCALGAALLCECLAVGVSAPEPCWACDGCEHGAAELLIACAEAGHARLSVAVCALGGGGGRAVLREVVACRPRCDVLCAVLTAVLQFHSGEKLAEALDDVQACLEGGGVTAFVVFATVLDAGAFYNNSAARDAVAHFMTAGVRGPDAAALVLAYVDACLGVWTPCDAAPQFPLPVPARAEPSASSVDSALGEMLAEALPAWLPAADPAHLAALLPAAVHAALAHPASVCAVRVVKVLARASATTTPALAVVCARLADEDAPSEEGHLFERLAPVLFAQVLLDAAKKGDDDPSPHAYLAQLLTERVAAQHECAEVRTAAGNALAALPPAPAIAALATHINDDVSKLADIARALQRVLLLHVRTAAAATDCTALAAALVRAATAESVPEDARAACVRCVTTLVQAQVQHARHTGPSAPAIPPVLAAVLTGISDSSNRRSSRVCGAVALDVVRSMHDVPNRAAVTPLLVLLVPRLVAAAEEAEDRDARAGCVDALGAALGQAHGADLLGADRTAVAAAALACREVRAALDTNDDARCAPALALLTLVLVQRGDALFRTGDAAALRRLQHVLALVGQVAQSSAPTSPAHRLAQTILSIVSE